MSYRYIGNKTRLVPRLLDEVRSVVEPGATVADLMCGTASFSEALRQTGFRVVAADIMTYAVHHARVRLLLADAPSFHNLPRASSYSGALNELNALLPEKGLFYREYGPDGAPIGGQPPRQYFSAVNAGRIDAINSRLNLWRETGAIDELENSLLRHDLVLAANRAANIAGTYGHFRSKWSSSALAPLSLQPAELIGGYPTNHVVLQGRAEDLSSSLSADLCYIDPPYMKRQYAANYHIIETLARGDDPEAVGLSGLRPWRDQYSDFCTKTKIHEAFRRVIEPMDCPRFVVSYSEDGLLSEHAMMELLSKFGEVRLVKIPYPRFRSNKSPLSSTVHEYLFHLHR
jgi:adenine-specific DNA-methyltransferase